MQNIHFYIAYLLTQHECVIVPNLGAFVVSPHNRKRASQWGILSPPENVLGFNPEIKHDDGLLSNSIAKERNCSCEEANLLIDQFVNQVFDTCNEGKIVRIPWVGFLYPKDNKILFQQDRILSCNAVNYGLTGFSMTYAKDFLQETSTPPPPKNKEPKIIPVKRRPVAYAVAAIAVLIIMCVIPIPLNNVHFNHELTKFASVVQVSEQNPISKQDQIPDEANVADTIILDKTNVTDTIIPEPSEIEPLVEKETSNEEVVNQTKKESGTYYYIIVASWPSKTYAKNAVAEFHLKGFKNTDILYTDGRYRIYIDCFKDKEEAESFLIEFRKDNPMYEKAWLLKHTD